MGMKLTHSHLEAIKKQLKASNKIIGALPKSALNIRTFKENEKQIKILTDEYQID